MKLIIDIDEETYIKAQAGILGSLGEIIANGTPYEERPQDDVFPMEIVAGKCPIEVGGNCPLKPQGDLVSRKWLTDAIRNRKTYLSYEDAKDVIDLIDNAPTSSDRYDEGYAQGYIDGSTGADWKGDAK